MGDTQVTSYFEANLNRSQFLSPLWPPFLILTRIGLQNLLTVLHGELQPVPTLWSFRGNVISKDFRVVYPIPLTPLLHVNLLPQAQKVPNQAAYLPPDSVLPAYFPISVSGLFLLPATQANILELTFESAFSHTPHWIHQEITTALPSKCIYNPTASDHPWHVCSCTLHPQGKSTLSTEVSDFTDRSQRQKNNRENQYNHCWPQNWPTFSYTDQEKRKEDSSY